MSSGDSVVNINITELDRPVRFRYAGVTFNVRLLQLGEWVVLDVHGSTMIGVMPMAENHVQIVKRNA